MYKKQTQDVKMYLSSIKSCSLISVRMSLNSYLINSRLFRGNYCTLLIFKPNLN